MDTKALKQKILDLAIRGKLVPQDPNDEPASVLLEKIRAEKQQMVKDGMLKSKDLKNDTVIFVGEDNLHYEKFNDGSIECIENEIPFALPKGWKWTRFGNIIKLMSGTSYPIEQEKREGKKLYVKVGDMNLPENSLEIVTSMQYLDDYSSSHLIPRNSVIFPKRGGAIATNKKKLVLREEIIVDLNTMAFTPISPVYLMYCYYWFLSIDISEINTGTSIPQINNKDINPLLFPLPPVKEQCRIASTIGTLLSRIDSINKNKAELSQLIEQTKTKILDLAIRGKLVPQDPNDEPASVLLERIRKEKDELIKAGKLKRDKRESIIFRGEDNSYYEKFSDGTIKCIDDELPFKSPKNWMWCELQDCCSKEIKRGRAPKYANEGNVLAFAQKCNRKTGGIDISTALWLDRESTNRYSSDEYMLDGDIVINSTGTGTLGRVGIYHDSDNTHHIPIVPDSHVTVVRAAKNIEPSYLFMCLKFLQRKIENMGEGSTNQKELKPLTVQKIRLPIPPYEEQKRIVKFARNITRKLSSIEDGLL